MGVSQYVTNTAVLASAAEAEASAVAAAASAAAAADSAAEAQAADALTFPTYIRLNMEVETVAERIGFSLGGLKKEIYNTIYTMQSTVGRASTGDTIWECIRRFHFMAGSKKGSFVNWKDPDNAYMQVRGTADNYLTHHEGYGWHAPRSLVGAAYLEFANPAELDGVTINDYCIGGVTYSGEQNSTAILFIAGSSDVTNAATTRLYMQPLTGTSAGAMGSRCMSSTARSSNFGNETAIGYFAMSRTNSTNYVISRDGQAATLTQASSDLPDGTLRFLGVGEYGLSLFYDGLGMDTDVIRDVLRDTLFKSGGM